MDVPTPRPPHWGPNATPSLNSLLRARRAFSAAILCASTAVSFSQVTQHSSIDDQSLRKYVGTYEWGPDHFVYLQMWSEFRGRNDLCRV
jgi:hypothetical protein